MNDVTFVSDELIVSEKKVVFVIFFSTYMACVHVEHYELSVLITIAPSKKLTSNGFEVVEPRG
jgi:hypothetical protein